jgi:hypothetical protein
MPSDNYFKVVKGCRILGLYTFDSHDAAEVGRAFEKACTTANDNGARHKDELTKPVISVWHKRTIIMADGPWSSLPAVGQVCARPDPRN